MLWLADCGLIHKLHRVSVPRLPLAAYEDPKAFKLFFVDVGLLSCMARLRPEALLDGGVLREFKGALTEQYVLQQLKTLPGVDIRYWTNDGGTAEVDFVADVGGEVIPIEVKAAVNLQSKSLRSYREKFSPSISIRSSMADYKREGWLLNLPLYAIETLPYWKENVPCP
jgi:predicted AAA+ superfamily ATPase